MLVLSVCVCSATIRRRMIFTSLQIPDTGRCTGEVKILKYDSHCCTCYRGVIVVYASGALNGPDFIIPIIDIE